MKKIVLWLPIFAAIVFSSSPSTARAGDFVNGLGSGIQYAGAAGWQGAYVGELGRIRLSLGYVGYRLGFDRLVSGRTTLGAQVFANQYLIGGALSMNYHLGPQIYRGWEIGLDWYRGVDTTESIIDVVTGIFDFDNDFDDATIEEEPENGVFLSIGYHFQ